MNENNINELAEYIFEKENRKIIRKINSKDTKMKELNIFFEEEETNVTEEIIKELSKYYIEDILKFDN